MTFNRPPVMSTGSTGLGSGILVMVWVNLMPVIDVPEPVSAKLVVPHRSNRPSWSTSIGVGTFIRALVSVTIGVEEPGGVYVEVQLYLSKVSSALAIGPTFGMLVTDASVSSYSFA